MTLGQVAVTFLFLLYAWISPYVNVRTYVRGMGE